MRSLRSTAITIVRRLWQWSERSARDYVDALRAPGPLADVILSGLDLEHAEQQRMLEELDVAGRVRAVLLPRELAFAPEKPESLWQRLTRALTGGS